MRIICMTNDAQLPMMKSMLMSAMKAGIDMSLFHCYILASQKEVATYNTAEFKSITTRKLELILENMLAHEFFMWVDNDIHFFQDCTVDVLSKSGNFIMQDDLWSPCTGFFLVWSNPATISLIKRSIQWLKLNNSPSFNDQHAFKACMNPIRGIDRITLLDAQQYPNGEMYFVQKQTSKARMVHCNFLKTTAEKVQRLKDYGFWDESDEAFYKTEIIFR
jgi:hypothetical protein